MKTVTLKEFQTVTGLSDSALLGLLKNNHLALNLSKEGEIQVDFESLETREMINSIAAKQQDLWEEKQRIAVEKFSSVITQNMEEIIEEAVAVYLARIKT